MEPRAPRGDQGRSRPPPRPRAAGQSALRRDQHAADAALYEKVYCARGDAENRIKELKALQIDRTFQTFSANQLRVLLTAAAYVLMQELRLRAADTACARAQVPWLRDRLLKLGVQVVCSVRRIVLRLPRATPDLAAWRHIAFALGARAG